MFRDLMKFSYRRTPLQAFGWYLVFLLISVVLAVFVHDFVLKLRPHGAANLIKAFEEGYQSVSFLEAEVINAVCVVVLGAMLLWNRPKNAVNILLVVGGLGLSALAGAVAGLIPLAVLTTRPSSTLPEVAKVFE